MSRGAFGSTITFIELCEARSLTSDTRKTKRTDQTYGGTKCETCIMKNAKCQIVNEFACKRWTRLAACPEVGSMLEINWYRYGSQMFSEHVRCSLSVNRMNRKRLTMFCFFIIRKISF